LTAAQKEVVRLAAQEGEVTIPRLVSLSGRGQGVVLGLIRRGVLSVRQADVLRASAPVACLGGAAAPIVPNADQRAALQAILKGLEGRRFTPCLLHGVTGSGKTEVYFLAIAEVLRQGGSVLFLVPEIGLTPQLLGRFSERFPHEPLAVLHSGVPPSIRYDSWRRICRGEIRVAVGARSALFAPLRGLRLIVVDEEHDESYKQEDRMRYNARDLALVKGRMEQATVVLGSATPAIQTYHHALSGRYTALSLPRRVEDRPLPRMEIVDMRLPENESGGAGDTGPILSRRLKEALRETLADRKQALLLLNRRGFHTFLLCRVCGYVLLCPHCDLALTLHARAGICTCHHCDYTLRATTRCPGAGGSGLPATASARSGWRR
jgi:primosomal protein N' (replication factor Y)